MTNVAHEHRQIGQTATKPRLLRVPTNLEVALAIARAEVQHTKPQKIQRLGASSLRAGVPLCKSTKLNEFGFARLQGQRKFIEALAEDIPNSFSIFPILAADYEVIDVPDQVGLLFESRLNNLLEPQVQKDFVSQNLLSSGVQTVSSRPLAECAFVSINITYVPKARARFRAPATPAVDPLNGAKLCIENPIALCESCCCSRAVLTGLTVGARSAKNRRIHADEKRKRYGPKRRGQKNDLRVTQS